MDVKANLPASAAQLPLSEASDHKLLRAGLGEKCKNHPVLRGAGPGVWKPHPGPLPLCLPQPSPSPRPPGPAPSPQPPAPGPQGLPSAA